MQKNKNFKIWTAIMTQFDVLLPLRWQIGPHFEELFALHMLLPIKDLRMMLKRDDQKAQLLKAATGNDRRDKDAYRVANYVLAPVLKKQGYRSLAQFERAYEDTDGNPPWPRGQ